MLALGARKAKVIPRNQDKGADIVATFEVAGAFEFDVAIQAKHYQPDPPFSKVVVDELLQGIAAESADLGLIVTTGEFSPETTAYASARAEQLGVNLKLVDGPALADLLIRAGMATR